MANRAAIVAEMMGDLRQKVDEKMDGVARELTDLELIDYENYYDGLFAHFVLRHVFDLIVPALYRKFNDAQTALLSFFFPYHVSVHNFILKNLITSSTNHCSPKN